MSTTLPELQPALPLADAARRDSAIPTAAGVALCLLLAVAQIAFAGYQIGAGNQPIQIAFLKHLADPALFASDDMLRQTLPLYPTYFFRLLAPLVGVSGLEPLYLMLQLLTCFGTLVSVYLLSRSIFKSHAAALAAAAILVAGHHRALAGEWLYTAWFTHTLVALPLALLALALFYRGGGIKGRWRLVGAFALAGVLFNLHALTAAYAILMMALALFADIREIPLKRWIGTLLLCAAAALVFAAPTLLLMLANRQTFDPAWINLMRVRSPDHSFPTTWWSAADPEIPRFILIAALFVLSWSFSPVRRRDTARALRVTVLMTLAVLLLFAAGYVFSEVWPLPIIIRLQPFRASRLMLVLMLIHIAYAAIEAIRTSLTGTALTPQPRKTPHPETAPSTPEPPFRIPHSAFRIHLPLPARIAEFLAGILILLTLAIPSLLPLLPLTVLAVLIAALVSGRLSITQSVVAVAALALAFAANRQIQFPIPLLSANLSLAPQFPLDILVIVSLLTALVAAILIPILRAPLPRALLLCGVLAVGTWGSWNLFARDARPGAGRLTPQLASACAWAKTATPKNSVFLAPSGFSGFRVFGERPLVADWRDGTQLYFSSAFGPDWLERISAIEPGLLLSPDGSRLVARGRSLDTLDDDELLAIAKNYHANYILLKTPPKSHPRTLEIAYADPSYTIYLPSVSPSAALIPQGVINPAEWNAMEKFMATTVDSNIEKYRKADVTIQVVDDRGRPVQDLPAVLEQTSHAFYFGCSMSFFAPNDTNPLGDEKAPPMTPEELRLFPEVFNATMPAFTGKWMYIEPQEGERHYEDLDRYFDYCQKNHIAVEYHFLTGLLPAFLRKDGKKAAEMFPEHAREVVARYKDKVTFWQVENDGYMVQATPPVFKELRAKYPDMKLGISDCVKFYFDWPTPKGRELTKDEQRRAAETRERVMYKGFDSGLLWLKKQGVQPDFFSMHGHQPAGLWADPRTMYEVFDRIAAEGVKLHISEAVFPLHQRIVGPVRRGAWTEELQADYLERFLTVCFSHPAMEMVNIWGLAPHGWGASGGLLDEHMKPRPAFDRLNQLINHTWHTHVETTLPLDGKITARAFHGNYLLTLTLPDGRLAQTTLTVPQSTTANLKFLLNPKTGTLTAVLVN